VIGDAAADVWWEGAPQPAAFVRRGLAPAAPVGAAFLAAGAVWEYVALAHAHLWVYPPAGALLMLIGVHGLVVRPLLLLRLARRTRYAVGRRGATFVWGARAEERLELPAEGLPPFTRRGGGGARGTPGGPPPPPDRLPVLGWWALNDRQPRFCCLTAADAQAALAALEKLEETNARPPAWAEGVVTPAGRRAADYSTLA
jgi:hypothetical protein